MRRPRFGGAFSLRGLARRCFHRDRLRRHRRRSLPDFPLGDALEMFVRREDAERFIEEVRGDEPEVAAKLRIEERELDAAGRIRRPLDY